MLKARLRNLGFALAGIVVFVAIGIALDKYVGIAWDTTYRVGCAIICLFIFAKIGWDYRTERWPWTAFVAAFLVNICIFFTPLVDRHASRGEMMIFALPDAVVFLVARTVSYPATDDHRRAERQQLILATILALAFCAIILSIGWIPERGGR